MIVLPSIEQTIMVRHPVTLRTFRRKIIRDQNDLKDVPLFLCTADLENNLFCFEVI